jgi:hypothetical protein
VSIHIGICTIYVHMYGQIHAGSFSDKKVFEVEREKYGG